MKMTSEGLVLVVAHLVITLAILIIYFLHPDDTLRNALLLIIGYWFGSMGATAIKNSVQNKNGDQ